MAQSIPEMYGSLVFNDKVMRSKLPKDMYKALKKTIENGTHLELDVANSVAVAMKEWATENDGRIYQAWFPDRRDQVWKGECVQRPEQSEGYLHAARLY